MLKNKIWAICLLVAVVHVFGFCFRRLAVILVSNFCPHNSQYKLQCNGFFEEHISDSEHQCYFHHTEV